MEYAFTQNILDIIKSNFAYLNEEIFEKSLIIKYLNYKTKSANKGAKSRASFANIYAIYVLVEDYLNKGFVKSENYCDYDGASFIDLFNRQRELPFGKKLQNHALNLRMNEEFKKLFPTCELIPILRDTTTNKYWFNEKLIVLELNNAKKINLAETVIQIIDSYILAKKESFENFIYFCRNAKNLSREGLFDFVESIVQPNIDARIFEIVSYSILKSYYSEQVIYWGFELKKIKKEHLKLFKTGRTNANDGGIDFVMKPLGKFFQVTESFDFNKYFLDIDKVEKYPMTFVIKSVESIQVIREKIKKKAQLKYSINSIVDKYMSCIEEIINIPILLNCFKMAVEKRQLDTILSEMIKQSIVEFNYDDSILTK